MWLISVDMETQTMLCCLQHPPTWPSDGLKRHIFGRPHWPSCASQRDRILPAVQGCVLQPGFLLVHNSAQSHMVWQEPTDALIQAWEEIFGESIYCFIRSIPRCCRDQTQPHGGLTTMPHYELCCGYSQKVAQPVNLSLFFHFKHLKFWIQSSMLSMISMVLFVSSLFSLNILLILHIFQTFFFFAFCLCAR